MNKRKSIIKLSLIIGALVIALVFTFLQISGVTSYRGVTGTIAANMGVEKQGGVILVYRAQETETNSKVSFTTQLDARMALMRMALGGEQGKNNALINENKDVSRQGSDKIRIESMRTSSVNAVTEKAETGVNIVFVGGSDNTVVEGDVIQNVRLFRQLSSLVLEVEVTDKGREALEERSIEEISLIDKVSKDAGAEEGLYLISKLPEDLFTEGKMKSNIIRFTKFDTTLTENDIYFKYFKLIAGSRPLTLTLLSADSVNGVNTDTPALLALLAGIAAAVLLSAFLAIRYKGLGIAAAVSLLASFTVLLFFAAVLPFSSLSFTALGVITLMMFLNAGSYILTFENIREEFAKGKTVQASAASGFKKAFWPLFDIHLFSGIAGAALWILGEGALFSAGMIILFASVLSFAAAAGLCRYLINLTMSVYGDDMDPSLFNLKNTLKDEVAK